MSNDKKPEITFLPGCFDSFEGTQEELDELVQKLLEFFESGEYLTNIQVSVSEEEILPDLTEDEIEKLIFSQHNKRTLH